MRDRRDDERSFRGPMGMGRDEDRFRDQDRDREWERERSWRRDEDMGGSRWSGASGRGGFETREEFRAEHGGGEQRGDYRDRERERAGGGGWGQTDERAWGRGEERGYDRDRDRDYGRAREGGYGGGWGGQREHSGMNMYGRQEEDRQWGRDRERYGAPGEGRGISRDFSGRGFDRDRPREDFDDRPRNLGARDYETRHFGTMRGGFHNRGNEQEFDRGYGFDRGFRSQGMQGNMQPGVLGGRGGGMRGEGWSPRMGGSDLGFSYRGHEGSDDIEDRGPHYGKGPKGYKRSDDRIREEVCDCIARQGHIDASDVEVKVESGTVVLTGTVGQRHHKRVLEQMVERLHGVDDVKNELRLKRDEQTQMRGQAQQTGQQGEKQNGDQTRQSQFPNGKNARA
jgi:hypothetical protein